MPRSGNARRVVASIFVNPTQFGPGEDFERYPRNLARDVAQLAPRGVDLVFAPRRQPKSIGREASTVVEPSEVTRPWEGSFRPGHFRGVATVVLKLFNMVAPDLAFFGQKDYQQSLVVRRMVTDLDVPVAIRVCPDRPRAGWTGHEFAMRICRPRIGAADW